MKETTLYHLRPEDGDGRRVNGATTVTDPTEVTPKIEEIMRTQEHVYAVKVVPEKRNVLESGDELNLQPTDEEYGDNAVLMDIHTGEQPFTFLGLDVCVNKGYRIVPQMSDESGDLRIFRVVKV